MPPQSALITQIYIGYFNRAPDPDGMSYWLGQLQSGMPAAAIATSFAAQPEAVSAYDFLLNPAASSADAFLNTVYGNLFNHAPDAAGLSYWKGELQAGKPAGRIILDIISGAQGNDKAILDNKAVAAQGYLDHVGGNAAEAFRLGDARRAVADVSANASSLSTALEKISLTGPLGNGLRISFNDASGTLAPYEAAIKLSAAAAWDMWAVHFTRIAPIEVEITYARGAEGVLASAGPAIEVYTGESYNGKRVTQSGVSRELATGQDPNGAAPDAKITLSADLARLAFRDSPDDPLPRDKLDALSIFAHEFGHVLGFRSALDANGQPAQGFITNYDRYISGTAAGALNYNGPTALQVKGGSVPLASSGPAHINVGGDLMTTSIGAGEAKLVGVLDLAVLRDTGLPVSLSAFDGFA